MTPKEREFTTAWWARLLADEAALVRWLQKLEGTERSGLQDNLDAAEKWCVQHESLFKQATSDAARNIFHATGADEERHADLLVDVLRGRGAWPKPPMPESAYWAEMETTIVDLKTCAAVFFLGERLAADRFQVIFDHPRTPADVRGFLAKALPDERHHARIFQKLTDAAAIGTIHIAHMAAVDRLRGKK